MNSNLRPSINIRDAQLPEFKLRCVRIKAAMALFVLSDRLLGGRAQIPDGGPLLACGVDIVEIDSVARAIELGGERFLKRIYTERELAFCRGQLAQLAAGFAAKEAISKALGTGLRGIDWRDMEVLSEQQGMPVVHLYSRAAARAEKLRLYEWSISLAYSRTVVIAFAAASGRGRQEVTGRQQGAHT